MRKKKTGEPKIRKRKETEKNNPRLGTENDTMQENQILGQAGL